MRAGDVVKHLPTGETWILAWADEVDVIGCGWPTARARVSDCVLVKAGTDAEYIATLKAVIISTGSESTRLYCKNELENLCYFQGCIKRGKWQCDYTGAEGTCEHLMCDEHMVPEFRSSPPSPSNPEPYTLCLTHSFNQSD